MRRIHFNLLLCCMFFLMYTAVSAMPASDNVTPDMIRVMLEHRLMKHDILQQNNIQIGVQGDKIILRGTVQTLAQKEQAEKDAHHVAEEYTVVDSLALAPTTLTNQQIDDAVLKAVQMNPFYDVFDYVTAQTQNGVVTLKGWVHEPWHKTEFGKAAERIVGVKKVDNQIQIVIGPSQVGVQAARVIYNDPLFRQYSYLQNPPIHVIDNNGLIILAGRVSSDSEKSWAGDLVLNYTNAVAVDNELQVKSP